ncbi:MAG: helix-turn-helix domain-containing protein [Actinomycetota bacterium]|nr:helix-turn-helix domain-containing protein [Actinomycetota bacterium]
MSEQKLLHTPEDAARRLGVGRTRLYALMADGQITSIRIGRSRRIPSTALSAYVERLLSEQTGPPAA